MVDMTQLTIFNFYLHKYKRFAISEYATSIRTYQRTPIANRNSNLIFRIRSATCELSIIKLLIIFCQRETQKHRVLSSLSHLYLSSLIYSEFLIIEKVPKSNRLPISITKRENSYLHFVQLCDVYRSKLNFINLST